MRCSYLLVNLGYGVLDDEDIMLDVLATDGEWK
jgi:hypothetical protein